MRAQAVVAAGLALLAGAVAAVFSHVLIDWSGDFLLRHDAYDDVTHLSRGPIVGIALALFAVGALRAAWELLVRRRGTRMPLRRLADALGGNGLAFIATAIAVALATIAGMEAFDALAGGEPIGGVADLFGGSLLLGVGATAACAALVALLARSLVRSLAGVEPAIAAFLVRLVPRVRDAATGAFFRAEPLSRALAAGSLLARIDGTRAPPLPAP